MMTKISYSDLRIDEKRWRCQQLQEHYNRNISARLSFPISFPIKEMIQEQEEISKLRKELGMPPLDGIGW